MCRKENFSDSLMNYRRFYDDDKVDNDRPRKTAFIVKKNASSPETFITVTTTLSNELHYHMKNIVYLCIFIWFLQRQLYLQKYRIFID